MEIEPEVLECMEDMIKKVVIRESKRKYRENNKDKSREYNKERYQKNKDKYKQHSKEYSQTPRGIKTRRISDWKRQGIICDDFDAMYDHYSKTSYCDICRCELTYDRYSTATTKCVDHDHTINDIPNFRNILCVACNVKRK